MPRSPILLVTALTLLALAGCSDAETPAETRLDVNQAASSGAVDVKKAVVERNEVAREGAADVRADVRDLRETADEAARDNAAQTAEVDLTQARATYDVSIERCEARSGSARTACKSEAQAVLDAARARIEARS